MEPATNERRTGKDRRVVPATNRFPPGYLPDGQLGKLNDAATRLKTAVAERRAPPEAVLRGIDALLTLARIPEGTSVERRLGDRRDPLKDALAGKSGQLGLVYTDALNARMARVKDCVAHGWLAFDEAQAALAALLPAAS